MIIAGAGMALGRDESRLVWLLSPLLQAWKKWDGTGCLGALGSCLASSLSDSTARESGSGCVWRGIYEV